MRKFYCKFVGAAAVVLLSAVCQAQTKRNQLPQITPKSPDVAAMETYNDLPVNGSSGAATSKVELYKLNVGSFSIDFDLSYHKNGLKVDEIPSSYGDGWMLNFGGAVSYQQRGLNDFKPTVGLFGGSALNDLKSYLRGQMSAFQRWDYLEKVIDGTEDSEFDLYNFNFFNNSGSYYYDTLMKPVIFPKSDFRITRTDSTITIRDNDNNTYTFNDKEYSISESLDAIEYRPYSADVSAYYLSSVLTKEGRRIRYKYKSYEYFVTRTHSTINFLPIPPSAQCGSSGMSTGSEKMTTSVLLPDSIVFDNGYVKFTTSAAVREDLKTFQPLAAVPSVTGFIVYNADGVKVKEFTFVQGYFGGNKRLKLAAVNEMNGSRIERNWTMRYNNDGSSPAIYSYSKDHWGYYGGSGTFANIRYSDIIPYWTSTMQDYIGNGSRNSSVSSVTNMLQSITYPTGGTDSIVYEPNQIKVRAYSQLTDLSPYFNVAGTHYEVIAQASTTMVGNISGSFTVPVPEPGITATRTRINCYATLDPSSFDSPTWNFTGPSGADLSPLYNTFNLNGNQYQTGGTIETTGLAPGTYTYSFTQGHDYNGGTSMTFNINFSVEVEKQDQPIPFLIGGVRVKQIVKTDSSGTPPLYRNFVYTDSLPSVAFRNIPNYISTTSISANYVSANACSACGTRYTVHDENIVPFAGSHIEYGTVNTYDSSAVGILGKTVNTYVFTNNEYGSYASPYVAPINTFWKSGMVSNQKIYKRAAGIDSLVEETRYDYLPFNRSNITSGIKVNYSTYCNLSAPTLTRSYSTSLSTTFTEQYALVQTTKRTLLPVKGVTSQTTTTFGSSAHTQPTLTASINSEGELVKEKITYSFDYDTSFTVTANSRAIRLLRRLNVLVPVERVQYRTIGGVDYVIGGTVTIFAEDRPYAANSYSLDIDQPVLMSGFTFSSTIAGAGDFTFDNRYKNDIQFVSYDEFNNVTSVRPDLGKTTAYFYDYKKMYPVAEVANAEVGEVAYTSFEADAKGNWTFAAAPVADATAPMGVKCYNASLGAVSVSGLNSGTTYLLSYWTKNAVAYSVAGTVSGYPQKGRSYNGWTLFVHRLTGVTSVSISSGFVDELRLYPADAMMKTYAYKPLVNVTTECDANNVIRYYHFDAAGNPVMIKDLDGKIWKMADRQRQTSVNF